MSTISTNPLPAAPAAPPTVLPFENGDHMSAAEFIRRWEAMPARLKEQCKRAELIEGVVRMPPISGGYHAGPHADLISLAGLYRWATPGVLGGAPASIILDDNTMPEPDAFLAIAASCGGRARLDDEGFVLGMPEWLAEIASSSVSYDLHAKKDLYRKFKVNEYVVWRVQERALDWFILEGSDFKPLPMVDGVFKSVVLPGLWLAASALVQGDYATLRQTLEQGLASDEHRLFVSRLQQAKPA